MFYKVFVQGIWKRKRKNVTNSYIYFVKESYIRKDYCNNKRIYFVSFVFAEEETSQMFRKKEKFTLE